MLNMLFSEWNLLASGTFEANIPFVHKSQIGILMDCILGLTLGSPVYYRFRRSQIKQALGADQCLECWLHLPQRSRYHISSGHRSAALDLQRRSIPLFRTKLSCEPFLLFLRSKVYSLQKQSCSLLFDQDNGTKWPATVTPSTDTKMITLIWLLSCQNQTDTAIDNQVVCIRYEHCCTSYCEAEGQTTHNEEENPCDCGEDYIQDPRECAPANGECQWINE